MVKPDGELIAQVMLYSQGYKTAEQLAGKIVSLFDLCKDQLSSQPHYDFGLRALKSVLVSAGNMKREEIMTLKKKSVDANDFVGQVLEDFEQRILLRSVCETIVPNLLLMTYLYCPTCSKVFSLDHPSQSSNSPNSEKTSKNYANKF